jgi:hypothetical protein
MGILARSPPCSRNQLWLSVSGICSTGVIFLTLTREWIASDVEQIREPREFRVGPN